MNTGVAIWFTGYSGAGKTTIAQALHFFFLEQHIRAEILDGDSLRDSFSKDLSFTRQDRETQGLRVGFITELLVKHGIFVIVSTISPYRNIRDMMRARIPRFFEVYIKCPLDECEKRDVKGLYKRVRSGDIKNFTGIDAIYEEPLNPDIICYTQTESVSDSVDKILSVLQAAGLLDETVAFPYGSNSDRSS